jgi:hypothetical protein
MHAKLSYIDWGIIYLLMIKCFKVPFLYEGYR